MSYSIFTRPLVFSKSGQWWAARHRSVFRNLHNSPLKTRAENFPTRQATIHVSEPENFRSNILKLRQSLRSLYLEQPGVPTQRNRAIVILVTRKLARYLNDSETITTWLNNLNHFTDKAEFDIVCGCVDGLAPNLKDVEQVRGRDPQEGFTILCGETEKILPRFLEDCATSSDEMKPGSITIAGDQPGRMSVTLPLANTLFITGRASTLFVSKWQFVEGTYTQTTPYTPIKSITLNALDTTKGSKMSYIPLLPITQARELSEGYGNIVRKIDVGGSSLPASSELEVKVPAFLEKALRLSPTIEIWALLFPKQLIQNLTETSPTSVQHLGFGYKGSFDIGRYGEIGYWISKGAKLCRVQSGGGGWGAKAGLLSLDPQTVYQDETTLQADDLLQAIGDIAQDGQFVQFFTPRLTRTNDVFPFRNGEYDHPHRKMVVLGTAPSTVDFVPSKMTPEQNEEERRRQERLDISRDAADAFHHTVCRLATMPFPPDNRADQVKANVDHSLEAAQPIPEPNVSEVIKSSTKPSTKKAPPKPSMYFRQGIFGFVSEGGMFLEQNANGSIVNLPTIRTKIDVPYAYWYNDFRNQEPRIRKMKDSLRIRQVAPSNRNPRVQRRETNEPMARKGNDLILY